MPPRSIRTPLIAWLLAASIPAAAASPLVLGVHAGPRIVPAIAAVDGRWVSLDQPLSEEATEQLRARAGDVVPAFARDAQRRLVEGTTMPVAQLTAALLPDLGLPLAQWYSHAEGRRPLSITVTTATQTARACNNAWSLAVEADAEDKPLLSSSRVLQAEYFVGGLDTVALEALVQPWSAAVAPALAQWRERSGTSSDVVAAIDIADLQQVQVAVASMPGNVSDQLEYITAQVAVTADGSAPLPVLVFDAWRLRTAAGTTRVLGTSAEVQTTAEGWLPQPRRTPWLLFEFDGGRYLLEWGNGLESSELRLLRLDSDTDAPAEPPLATGAAMWC